MKLDRVQERIKSRLSGGLIVDIEKSPDLELKNKIIKKNYWIFKVNLKKI